jgi:hypothetical protein
VSGLYAAMPHCVLDSVAYQGASFAARVLLFELVRQHNGREGNNGRLHFSPAWLRRRGWASICVIERAKKELVERRLTFETRKGCLTYPSWFALTWLSVSNPVGLDPDRVTDFLKGAYATFSETIERDVSRTRAATLARKAAALARKKPTPLDGAMCTVQRCDAKPLDGVGEASATPLDGAKTAISGPAPAPLDGNNSIIAIGGREPKRRVLQDVRPLLEAP